MSFNYTYNYPQVARDSGFKLRNYKDGPLDWRLIGSLEVERILKDQSLEQIDAVLSHLSEAPLGSILDSNILDSGIVKYFILSQFSVQYLLFCRKFLEETVADLRESHGTSQMELVSVKRSLAEANNEVLQLHKKITQIEAIHEVIYPCHLCTKNFVSNDALNLHISRKHSGIFTKTERKSEAPQSLLKDRENDLTLINTIKLELEIKHLKERLSNAEREIKEKNTEPRLTNGSPLPTETLEKSEQISVHSIGIQSNLSEIKEKDDNSDDDMSSSSQSRQQMCMLQEKLQEFEKWKEEQKIQNSKFLTEVNNKLQELGSALELTKNQMEHELDSDKQNPPSSVKDLEILLSKKLEDISKASTAKLEAVVNKLEMSYKDKLDQLERELIKIHEQSIVQKHFKSNDNQIKRDKDDTSNKSKEDTFQIVELNDETPNKKEVFEIGLKEEVEKLHIFTQEKNAVNETSISESNHTFVKHSKYTEKKVDNHNKSMSSGISDDESTDISDSLSDEEHKEIKNNSNKINTKKTLVTSKKVANTRQQPPKVVTKKEATKLTNQRLLTLGVNMRTKSLPSTLKKRISTELNENRNKLKQEHPHFYATRNKIKKFVDKLCSTKMPENAEALLKATKPVRTKIQEQQYSNDQNSVSDENDEALEASTPLNVNTSTTDNNNFKQRLERILSSPIRKPDEHIIKAIVHPQNLTQKPVPMPRKRVMFHHPDQGERRLTHSLSISEINEPQIFKH
ncbi:zinc finger protein DZIP1L isoform X2 [Lucilia sericata]|uniref:zinc finger protein DZIP1L isoform X2 n=1 Tax=Lucilia sericata TaxID=13632 RepID=UPI0018A7E8EB|nr:zinc finger protein DZIP1L isoform X2 [Lucilia sericata]